MPVLTWVRELLRVPAHARSSDDSHAIWELEVAGDLDVDPQPTIIAATARHHTTTPLDLGKRGRVRLCERVQIGRTDERQGFWSGAMHADVAGAPPLRH